MNQEIDSADIDSIRKRLYTKPAADLIDDGLDDLLQGCGLGDDKFESAKRQKEKVVALCAQSRVSADDLARRAVQSYIFPSTSGDENGLIASEDDELSAALGALVEKRDTDGRKLPYHHVRSAYCSISLAMNRAGVRPPRFRPIRALPIPILGQKPCANDTLMMLDRQVIDLHWLHCRGKREVIADSQEFAELFAEEEFDFELASRFAAKAWTIEKKTAKVLNLVAHEEWQMAILRTKAEEDKWRSAIASMKTTIDRRLREQLFKEPALKSHIEDFKLLWLADKMAGHYGQGAIGRVHGWLTGRESLAPSTLSSKLRRMRRRTAPKGSRV